MKIKGISMLAVGSLASLLAFGIHTTTVSAQGRGGGMGRGGGGGSTGNPGMGGRPSNPGVGGVDRGIGTASDRSGGRSDTGRARASENSSGRSDRGTDHARAGRNNRVNDTVDKNGTSNSSRRFTGLARKLNTTPEALQSQYQAARATNPDLKFGQFVAANVVASNLSATNPNVTTSAILSGLQSGKSIGQTLQNLGVSKSEAKAAEKKAKHAVK